MFSLYMMSFPWTFIYNSDIHSNFWWSTDKKLYSHFQVSVALHMSERSYIILSKNEKCQCKSLKGVNKGNNHRLYIFQVNSRVTPYPIVFCISIITDQWLSCAQTRYKHVVELFGVVFEDCRYI